LGAADAWLRADTHQIGRTNSMNKVKTYTGRRSRAVVQVALALLAALATSACGGDERSAQTSQAKATGNGVDRAFVADMVPHHKSAVEMAKVASERAERPEIQQLAKDIVASQNAEITTMARIDEGLAAGGVKPGELGMAMHEMQSADMDAGMLRDARPFEREFIDMMVPHHQDAIKMARVELDKGQSGELKQVAKDIVAAQAKEIREMNGWRTDWYGKPSPAGGVPVDR